MRPVRRFLNQSRSFWAHVRTISQAVGYTQNKRIKVPSLDEIRTTYKTLGLDPCQIGGEGEPASRLGTDLRAYFTTRARLLNQFVEPQLMDAERARVVFEELYTRFQPQCPIPTNKQKGNKRAPAYLTGIVNMLVEQNAGSFPCDYDPRKLTTIIQNRSPLRTLARRIDGAFPSTVNPIAVWEIKEYYYTTTFGSRVADGVYESLLDGMELEELYLNEGIKVFHYLIVDSHYTWWECGKSYLCRIFDMLHMGYVDEVLFGHEVVERLPVLVRKWRRLAQQRRLSN